MRSSFDLLASGFCILVGSLVVTGSLGLGLGTPTEPAPGFFPFVSGVSLIVFSVILLGHAWFGKSSGVKDLGKIGRPGVLTGALLIYSLLLDPVGYFISTFFLSSVVLLVLDVKKLWKILLTSFLTSLGSYALFDRFLGISLPPGIFKIMGY